MSVQHTNKSNHNLAIGSYAKNSNRGQASTGGNNFGPASKQNQGSIVDRLNAIDERYKYKSSLLSMFDRMDANAIK